MKAKRILIVEDDADMAGMIEDLLKRQGYETRHAADGDKALKAVRDFSPDGIILDYMLPGIGGAALREEFEKHESGRAPVLFLSALSEHELRRGAVFNGRTYYMSKPYKAKDFVDVVEQMISLGANPSGF